MPKLSKYVDGKKSQHVREVNEKEEEAAAGPREPARLMGQQPFDRLHPRSSSQVQPAEGPSSVPELIFTAAANKFGDAYAKRLREHGPRLWRWPDGSLREDSPASSSYSASNRQRWEPVVHYCRTHGGDRAYDSSGHSLRYGVNVTPQQHSAYLQQAQLEPEGHKEAEVGMEQHENPLDDPQHALNSFYKDFARNVLGDEDETRRRGRLI